MNWEDLPLPELHEDITLYVNDTHEDITRVQFLNVMKYLRESEESGEVFYTIWAPDGIEETMKTIAITFKYKEGYIDSYQEEVLEDYC